MEIIHPTDKGLTLKIDIGLGCTVIVFGSDERHIAERMVKALATMAEGKQKERFQKIYERVRVTHTDEEVQ